MLSSVLKRNKLQCALPTGVVFDRFCSARHYEAAGGGSRLMSKYVGQGGLNRNASNGVIYRLTGENITRG